jgi:hypothetical protein
MLTNIKLKITGNCFFLPIVNLKKSLRYQKRNLHKIQFLHRIDQGICRKYIFKRN